MCLAVPGMILDVHDDRGVPMATVDFGGATKHVCLAYLPELGVGDWVIVHVGFAIAQVDEAAARQTLELIREIGELEEVGVDVVDGGPS